MNIYELAVFMKTARKVVDEEWKKLSPERRKRICDSILERSRKRKGFPRGPESGPPNR